METETCPAVLVNSLFLTIPNRKDADDPTIGVVNQSLERIIHRAKTTSVDVVVSDEYEALWLESVMLYFGADVVAKDILDRVILALSKLPAEWTICDVKCFGNETNIVIKVEVT